MKIRTLVIASTIVLSGCTHEVGLPDFYATETEEKFGVAVRQNIAAQTVNPNGAEGDLSASGARTAEAIKRYLEDDVEEPAITNTLSSGSGNGSGSGSGGSSN